MAPVPTALLFSILFWVPHVSPLLRDMGIRAPDSVIPRSRNFGETWGTPVWGDRRY